MTAPSQALQAAPSRAEHEGHGLSERHPGIPDSIFAPESFIFPVFDYDWGRDFDESEANGVPTQRAAADQARHQMLVPRVNADGNEMGGVPTVQVDAPLGTYLGWNITAGPGDVGYDGRPFHAAQVCNYIGAWCPSSRPRRSGSPQATRASHSRSATARTTATWPR